MRYLKNIGKKVVLFVIVVSSMSCGTWGEYYVSQETSSDGNERSQNIDGVDIYVIPHNRYEIESNFSPWYVPLVPTEGKGYQSYYYYEELGSYSKPLKDNLDYFMVELLVNPYVNAVSIDVSSLQIVRESGAVVNPERFHLSEAWVLPKMRGKAISLEPGEISCLHLQSFDKMTPITVARREEIKAPTCFLLKYPIAPVHPSEKFSFIIGEAAQNTIPISPVEIKFAGEKIKEFSGYRMGP